VIVLRWPRSQRVRVHQESRHARGRRLGRSRRRDSAPLRARILAAGPRGDLGARAQRSSLSATRTT